MSSVTDRFSTFEDGGRGHLEGLASVYCELLMAPFTEVLAALEEARQRAWSERSPHSSSGGGGGVGGLIRGHRGNSCHGGLPNSHSQPIYVPGKYSVIRPPTSVARSTSMSSPGSSGED
uniref:Uncharacterized protein n=1 Tax=Anopheles albimanus TaxID=7167 RepID=A0A182F779_ANOAL